MTPMMLTRRSSSLFPLFLLRSNQSFFHNNGGHVGFSWAWQRSYSTLDGSQREASASVQGAGKVTLEELLPEETVLEQLFSKGAVSVPPVKQREIVSFFVEKAANQREAVAAIPVRDLVALGILVFQRTSAGPSVAAAMFEEASKRKVEGVAEEKSQQSALYSLAEMWRTGMGTVKDEEKALKTYEDLAGKGHPLAQYNLGNMYMVGNGVAVDKQRAFSLYEASVAQGIKQGHFNLALMLLNGEGTAQNIEKGVEHLEAAAKTGNHQALFFLGSLLGKGQHMPEDQNRAFECFVEAAKGGLDRAQFNVGHCYFLGKGVPQSFEKAAEHFHLAADQGFTYAQVNLGNMYSEGRGVPKDLEKAKYYFRLAAPFNTHAKLTLAEIESEWGKAEEEKGSAPRPSPTESEEKKKKGSSCVIQ